ncbi:MAG: aldo/keto reductase [Bryobacteraceae bacterium]
MTDMTTSERVDPVTVPYWELSSGARIPVIGLGTFGSDHTEPDVMADAVRGAYEVGCRHFDCAAVYGNEDRIGAVFQDLLKSGVRRDSLWITSKLWNDMHAEGKVEQACRKSLAELRLDYLDLYVVHWPFPNWHPPGCTVESRAENARPYIHADFLKTWRQMERLVDMGLVRHIGTSNMTIPKLQLLLRDARVKPAVNEMELHPHLQQPELFDFVVSNGIVPVGYCPLGSPNRPERDRTVQDTVDMEDPVIVGIAKHHGVHPSAICLKWAVQRGQVPIPMSTKRKNYLANLQAVTSDPLTRDEMARIARIDRGCRLVKGQVFLWKPGQSWEDLWDLSGEITPP